MTIQEFIASGRKGRVVGSTGPYKTASEFGSFTVGDISATFELEPERVLNITRSKLAEAWDAACPPSGSVAGSASSQMFARMVRALGL